MQDLSVQVYENKHLDVATLRSENKLSEISKLAHLDTFTCMVCNPMNRFESHKRLAGHLEEKDHKYKMTVFRENL